MSQRICILLLAAGSSSRLGEPKQLLDAGGEPLIRRVARHLTSITADPVGVVVGANSDRIIPALSEFSLAIIVNEQWSLGIGTSIAAGIAWAKADASIDAAMIVLCDQPDIDVSHFQRLLERARQTDAIVATEYAGAAGVPAVFPRSMFNRLIALPPDHGAKSLLNDPSNRVERIECASASTDLDTREDVERWRAK